MASYVLLQNYKTFPFTKAKLDCIMLLSVELKKRGKTFSGCFLHQKTPHLNLMQLH